MRLNVKALALAVGILWGFCVLLVGAAHVIWPSYGGAFMELVASLYPGMRAAGGYGGAAIGALYGLVDGAIAGAILGWLYNRLARIA